MDHILYQIFKIFFEYIYIHKHGEMTVNPSIRIYTNKTLELLTPQVQWNYLEALKDTKKWYCWKCSLFRNYWSSIDTLWSCY